ncbi:MAG: amylo-alpha-1,6-glucosidase, partial [Phycisphaerales bacterium JB065]
MSVPFFAVDIADPVASGKDAVPLHRTEWMLPTGHGGFAMGCCDGFPGRRYHTLLNAAANPPVDRIATVGEPRIAVNGVDVRTAPLRVEKCGDRVRWESKGKGWTVERELAVGHRDNTAALRVVVKRERASEPIAVSIALPVLLRDFHKLDAEISAADFEINPSLEGFEATRAPVGDQCHQEEQKHRVRVRAVGAAFREEPSVETGIAVPHELDRGDTTTEARFCPGVFEAELASGEDSLAVEVLIAFGDDELPVGLLDDRSRGERIEAIASRFEGEDLRALAAASDEFLVQRIVGGESCMSVIAGYPWFADWGRDTMIALPGLLLVTGRHEDAMSTLRTYARHVSEGMIPN